MQGGHANMTTKKKKSLHHWASEQEPLFPEAAEG